MQVPFPFLPCTRSCHLLFLFLSLLCVFSAVRRLRGGRAAAGIASVVPAFSFARNSLCTNCTKSSAARAPPSEPAPPPSLRPLPPR